MPKLVRDSNGSLPAYAWPGGYPVIYIMGDGGVLCPECANGENGSEASEFNDDKQWRITGQTIHYEGAPETCCHCGAEIESAYGNPDEEKD